MSFFQPASLDKECQKAAKILKTFVDKNKIPNQVLQNAKGLAIFSGFRAGMYLAGAGGSGVVVARLPDGTWSQASAFKVMSGSFGIVYGVDMYDCICVLNTEAALEAYTKPEMNLGMVALAAGPIGVVSSNKEVAPVWTYTRSRGLYGGVAVDGTVIKERPDVNAEFYGSKVSPAQILKGDVNGSGKASKGLEQLMQVVWLGEGKDVDSKVIQQVIVEYSPGEMRE